MAKLSKREFKKRLDAFLKRYVIVCKEMWFEASLDGESIEPVVDRSKLETEITIAETLKYNCGWCGEVVWGNDKEQDFIKHVKKHVEKGEDLLPSEKRGKN